MPVLSVAKILPRRALLRSLRLNLFAMRSIRQAAKADGCLGAIAAATKQGAFAISLWKDPDSLQRYVRSGAHAQAAQALREIATGHVSRHQEWDGPLPEWHQWGDLLADGRFIPTRPGMSAPADAFDGPARRPRLPLRT